MKATNERAYRAKKDSENENEIHIEKEQEGRKTCLKRLDRREFSLEKKKYRNKYRNIKIKKQTDFRFERRWENCCMDER